MNMSSKTKWAFNFVGYYAAYTIHTILSNNNSFSWKTFLHISSFCAGNVCALMFGHNASGEKANARMREGKNGDSKFIANNSV